MPDARRVRCQACGKSSEEVGPISWRGLCNGCGKGHVSLAVNAMVNKRGPIYRDWKHKTIAGVLGVPLDAIPTASEDGR